MGQSRGRHVSFFLWVLTFPLQAHAAVVGSIWYVDGAACKPGATGQKNAPFCTIQEGINAAADFDEVIVAVGTYLESIDLLGKAITLRSTNPDDPAIVRTTIIDGNSALHVIRCTSGESAATVISGFTITGGNANAPAPDDVGGGMYCVGAGPTVRKSVFYNNLASSAISGAALYLEDAGEPLIEQCTFAFNHGAAIFAAGSSALNVRACSFVANGSTGVNLREGASASIVASSFTLNDTGVQLGAASDVVITGSRFSHWTNNAVRVSGAATSTHIGHCTFAGGPGTAIFIFNTSGEVSATIYKSIFAGIASGNVVAAINVFRTHLTVDACEFHGNSTSLAVMLSGHSNLLLNNSVFTTNAGSVVQVNDGTATADKCTFENNQGDEFGILHQSSGVGTITRCTFIGSSPYAVGAEDGVAGLTVSDSVFCENDEDFAGVVTDAGGNTFGPPCGSLSSVPVLANFDADGDGDVDLADHAVMTTEFSGPLP